MSVVRAKTREPNDPRDIFASDEWADAHPETYGSTERSVSPGCVAEGLDNAGKTEERKLAMLRYLRRGKR